jgi:hypothetical protein
MRGDGEVTNVTGPDLKDAKQVTNTNPFQTNFAWGRSELLATSPTRACRCRLR